ncbi:HD-GYP domain-containing protein [Rudaea sp.]|uniref:HD-GYP domain-containing protein n=1 Tax=Rudaea sp. TaxID=2136325 RepID=UPI00378484A0
MNIVVVDDQHSARLMMRKVVEGISQDVRVFDFGDPIVALKWSKTQRIDLLLLDYRMPGFDGLEFARRFRRLPANRDVPIVLISVVGDEPLRQAALDAGVIDFLVKPVRPRELRARFRNLLSLRRQGESVKERARSLEERLLANLQEVENREREILFRLAKAAEYRDFTTGIHLMRMSHYVELLAEELGLPEDDVRCLTLAAPLHDIGKIGIPDSILQKKGGLTDEEMRIMRHHPLIGHEILRDSQSKFIKMAAVIALRHHERWDGSGYPDGLKGNEIPLAAQIVSVADVYDALTTERPYKSAWSSAKALDYLVENRGVLFSPVCVDVMLANQARLSEIQYASLAAKELGY